MRLRLIAIGILKTEQKKTEKVPLQKGQVPKIIEGAQEHPETYVDPPLRGLMSQQSAAQTPFRVRPPSPHFPSEHYEIEEVINARHKGRGKKLEYLVHWKGYPASEWSWVKADNLNAPELLKEFYLSKPAAAG